MGGKPPPLLMVSAKAEVLAGNFTGCMSCFDMKSCCAGLRKGRNLILKKLEEAGFIRELLAGIHVQTQLL